jgi:hypothetical protein
MSHGKLLGLLTATMLVLSGCADTPGAGVQSASPSAADPVVSLVRTGGFAGVHDEVTIGADGSWTVTDRTGTSRTGHLTDQQRDALRRLAADPRLAQESTRIQGPSRCADVYNYVLTVNGRRISFIDCPTDDNRPLASIALIELATRATSG